MEIGVSHTRNQKDSGQRPTTVKPSLSLSLYLYLSSSHRRRANLRAVSLVVVIVVTRPDGGR